MNLQLSNSGGAGNYDRPACVYSTDRPAHYVATKEDYTARFYRNVRRWRFDTSMVSSVDKAVAHPAFREIVDMGERVVPLIISEIRTRPDMLMIALQLITGADPVQPRHRGRVNEMASDWIDWYSFRG